MTDNSSSMTWSNDDLAAWNRLAQRAKVTLVNKYGEGKVPPLYRLDLADLEATAPRWGQTLSNAVRAALGQPVDTTTRMALDETERALILEHRARTATTRAYNEGVEAAAALVDANAQEGSPTRALAVAIRALLRKV